MIEIPDTDRQEIERLLPTSLPTRPRAIAVLDGVLAGAVWTDGSAHPGWAVVIESADGTVYAGGDVGSGAIARVFAEARTKSGDLIVGFREPLDPLRRALPPDPYYAGEAIDFTDRMPPEGEPRMEASALPPGFSLSMVDAALLPSLEWGDDTLHAFGSARAWTERGIGSCVLDASGGVVAHSLAGPRVRGWMEMGVWTHEAHRRRGLGTLVSARTARACEASGARVWWNANADNAASITIARRLGFRRERRYELVAYRTQG